MPVLTLKSRAKPDKYGVVVVHNADGTFNREFKITGVELATLHASGNGVPPGVTRREWEGGLAHVAGKGFDVGDVAVGPSGHVRMKLREGIDNGRIIEQYLDLKPGEYTGTIPNISVEAAKLTVIKAEPNRRTRLRPVVQIDSVVDGAVTWR